MSRGPARTESRIQLRRAIRSIQRSELRWVLTTAGRQALRHAYLWEETARLLREQADLYEQRAALLRESATLSGRLEEAKAAVAAIKAQDRQATGGPR